MLITSGAILPIRHGNGSPVASGRLYVTESGHPGSRRLEIFRDAAMREPAPNPLTLNSAGELPYPAHAKEDSGWCHVYAREDGRERFLKSYPLREMPRSAGFRLPEKFSTLKVRTKAIADDPGATIKNSVDAARIKTGSVQTFGLGAGEIGKIEASRFLPAGRSEGLIISPACIAQNDGSNDPENPEDWWKTFKIGSYGVALCAEVVGSPFYLGRVCRMDIYAWHISGSLDGTAMGGHFDFPPDAKKVAARIHGRLSEPRSIENNRFAYYLVCRVEDYNG